MCKASELVAVKSKADEVTSQKAAIDDHIITLKVTAVVYQHVAHLSIYDVSMNTD